MSAYRYGWSPRQVECPGSGEIPVGEPFVESGVLSAFCPWSTCGGVYAVRKDGRLRKHKKLNL
jgi:hypothetical protein